MSVWIYVALVWVVAIPLIVLALSWAGVLRRKRAAAKHQARTPIEPPAQLAVGRRFARTKAAGARRRYRRAG
jgi:hypothetical protein